MKKNLHFVYSFPELKNRWVRIDFIFRKILGFSLKERFYLLRNWPNPIQAPLSISFNICNVLSKYYNVFIYDIQDSRDLYLAENDIFVGHLWPNFDDYKDGNNSWNTFDPNQITNKVVIRYPNDPRVFILAPFNHSVDQTGWMVPLLDKINTFIGITGDYWVLNLNKYAFFNNLHNFQQLNMAIDVNQYPFLKKKFNKKGERKFLYIGRLSKEKNISLLENISLNPQFEGGYISNGKGLEGWRKISDFRYLSPDYIKTLVSEYDFFVNASDFDAQATTVLEAMSWGFMILCTQQSGYTHDSMFFLDLVNNQFNSKLIKELQNTDEEKLLRFQKKNLELLYSKYSWNLFTSKLLKILNY